LNPGLFADSRPGSGYRFRERAVEKLVVLALLIACLANVACLTGYL
jgi:hypothetical protein